MTTESPLTQIKGIGEELAKKFASVGVVTAGQLITYYPRRYEDYSVITPIARIKPGIVTIRAVIKQAKGRYVRRGMHVTEAVASDETGSVRLVWFNQPYREKALKPGIEYFISGQFGLNYQRLSIMNPSVELTQEFPINTARIVPVYRETKGLNTKYIRRVVRDALALIHTMPETLPLWLVHEYGLMNYAQALENIHFPENIQKLEAAKRRLGFDEVFALSLASLLNKRENQSETSLAIPFNEQLAKSFVSHLPFKLTSAQRKVVWRIYQDLQDTQPMNRLVEGDVGSGKTVVATMAALMAMEQGYQVALMAPTELLARQHANTVFNLLQPLGYDRQVDLLVGGMTTSQKIKARHAIKNGDARFIIGTHALIQEKVDMQKLGLVVIDEQHRFGVEQRKKLMAKAGHMPHVLNLTATPIPRSLALTLYGELDISIIDEKPADRKPIITKLCSPNSRTQLYEKIKVELNKGRQLFVVCPLISESTSLLANSAEKIYEQLATKDFKQWRVGLLHGKLKSDEKNKVMEKFIARDLDILVSTTVIEVGVDVPNATVMMIESADRFGLAQIHQLRGRVGRSGHQGYCYLMMSDSSAPSRRLRALERSNDGFELADLDLELRGAGAIYGTLQHGQLDLRIAKLSDVKLISNARTAAQEFIQRDEALLQYRQLSDQVMNLRMVTNLN